MKVFWTWFSMLNDKFKHMLVCFLVAFLVGVLSPFAGVSASVRLSIGKEYGDSQAVGNRWDWSDVGADTIGIAIGISCAMVVRFMLRMGQ